MNLRTEDWNNVESILARIESLDSAKERLAFGKRILGEEPMRRSYFRGLVETNGLETFATLWNAAIKNINDLTITTNYLREMERLSIRTMDKQWIKNFIPIQEPEHFDAEPPPVVPEIPTPAGHNAVHPPPAAPKNQANVKDNFGINAGSIHIRGDVHIIGPGQPTLQKVNDSPKDLPTVRFTIRQASEISARTKHVKARLVREDVTADQNKRTEVDVRIAVPTWEQKEQIATYFNSELTGDSAHAAQELMSISAGNFFRIVLQQFLPVTNSISTVRQIASWNLLSRENRHSIRFRGS
jgi:hypothetical protein